MRGPFVVATAAASIAALALKPDNRLARRALEDLERGAIPEALDACSGFHRRDASPR
jgi:hypothetical protein